MPVIYAIDKTDKVIRTKCVGQVSLFEVLDHFRTLEQDVDCPANLDVVLDLTAQQSVPSTIELQAVADQIRRVRDSVQFGICAIAANSDAVYGSAMVFEVLAAKNFRVTKVFPQVEEAENWLSWQRSLAN